MDFAPAWQPKAAARLFNDGASADGRVCRPEATPGTPGEWKMADPALSTLTDCTSQYGLGRLKRRREFLRAANAPAWKTRGVIVQAHKRDDQAPARVGFTVTRRLGNAVRRNRIRRRMREAVRLTPSQRFLDGCDYVFIGRMQAHDEQFTKLMEDIDHALEHLNKGQSNHHFRRRPGK